MHITTGKTSYLSGCERWSATPTPTIAKINLTDHQAESAAPISLVSIPTQRGQLHPHPLVWRLSSWKTRLTPLHCAKESSEEHEEPRRMRKASTRHSQIGMTLEQAIDHRRNVQTARAVGVPRQVKSKQTSQWLAMKWTSISHTNNGQCQLSLIKRLESLQ